MFYENRKPGLTIVNGNYYYFLGYDLHREDGPAVELASGTKEWWLNGKLHREDGPAIEYANGTKEWWLNGKNLSEEEFLKSKNEEVVEVFRSGSENRTSTSYFKKGTDILHREDGPAYIQSDGHTEWLQNGLPHREDGPAIETANNKKFWYKNGKLHRENGPAVEYPDGRKEWWIEGVQISEEEFVKKTNKTKSYSEIDCYGTTVWYKDGTRLLHREDGPAIERVNGDKFWCLNGQLHREDGPAIEYANGDKEWYLNNKLHREDGPAIERVNGDKFWCLNGQFHREDGPACEYANGGREYYYLGGIELSKSCFEEKMATRKKKTDTSEIEIKTVGETDNYYKKGTTIRHRTDGPAVYQNDTGYSEWWQDGKRHRTDGPAIFDPDGGVDDEWYFDGKLHREDGPAVISYDEYGDSATETWYTHGVMTRQYTVEDGYTIYYDDKGNKHRKGGPAVENENNDIEEWWTHGRLTSRREGSRTERFNERGNLHGDPAVEDEEDDLVEQWDNGVLVRREQFGTTEFFDKDGEFHNDNGPAIINEDDDVEEWWTHGNMTSRREGTVTEFFDKNGEYHNDNGPAIRDDDTDRLEWWRHGILIKKIEGGWTELFDKDGSLHCGNGPARFSEDDDSEEWFNHGTITKLREGKVFTLFDKNEEYHNDNGPAIWDESSKYEEWYKHGKLHRLDGPAHITDDGKEQYFIEGVYLTENEFYNHPKVKLKKLKKAEEEKLEEETFDEETNDLLDKTMAEWLEDSDYSYKKEVKKMANVSMMDILKVDGEDALYRIAGTQMTKGTKAAILKLLESQGHGSERIKAFSEILDTEGGSAAIAMVLGMALHYIPQVNQDPRAQRLSKEFRVKGMEIAGNAVFDVAISSFLPVILESLNALPQPAQAAQQLRVATPPVVIPEIPNLVEDEQEEVVATPKRKSRSNDL